MTINIIKSNIFTSSEVYLQNVLSYAVLTEEKRREKVQNMNMMIMTVNIPRIYAVTGVISLSLDIKEIYKPAVQYSLLCNLRLVLHNDEQGM